jgi:DNA primase
MDFEAQPRDIAELKTETNAKKIATQYVSFDDRSMACCPNPEHDDSTPSFNLFATTDGAWICGCFGCKWHGNVAQMIAMIEGIRHEDAIEKCWAILDGVDVNTQEYLEASQARLASRTWSQSDWWDMPVVAEYVYHDEHNAPAFRVERRESWTEADGVKTRTSKQFPIFHYLNGRGVVGKPPGDAYDRILFHLPQLLNAPVVMLNEGEKDVLSAEAQGFVATTNAGGAGNLTARHMEWLRGKTVIDASDNDAAGRERSRTIARLGKAVGANLVRVRFPDGIKDVTEYFEKGHTAEDLKKLIS